MNKNIRMSLAMPLVALALALEGCSATPQAPAAPTVAAAPATPVVATATPIPPPTEDTSKATAAPADANAAPTATAAATAASASTSAPLVDSVPGAAPATTALKGAVQKFVAVPSYRAELTMQGSGDLGLTTDQTPTVGSSDNVLLFSITGDFKGEDAHYTLKGFLSSILGVDADTGVEAMLVGGKGYVHGPVSLLGAMENKWYVLGSDQTEAIRPPLQVADFLSGLDGNVDLSLFKATAKQSVDGQNCIVYSADKDTTLKAFNALNSGVIPGVEDLTTVQAAEAHLAVCDDGYVHQLQMTIATATKDQPVQKATFGVNIHIHDFGANIAITAPNGATQLQSSDTPGVTPTPKK